LHVNMGVNKIYIPTFISSVTYEPVRVLPHVYFYNGTKQTNNWYVEGYTNSSKNAVNGTIQSVFPYFDNYSGNTPTSQSLSLLFNNETAPYGDTPSGSLYTEYWETYVSLLYNPRTRLINASAIIPLADYFKMELNNIVFWKGNYYHLRAINDYSVKTGECSLQLLGPIIPDTLYKEPPIVPQASSSVSWSYTETRQDGTFTVYDNATTLATLTADGNGNTQISQSHYVTASLAPVSYPSSGSVTMSINVNGGTTLAVTGSTNTTISASFLVGAGQTYNITGSIIWNDSPPSLVSGYKVYFDFGNSSSYPGSGTTVTNLGSGGSAMNGTLVNGPTWSSTNGGILDLSHNSSQYIQFNTDLTAAFTTFAIIKGKSSTWGPNATYYNGFPNIRGNNGLIVTGGVGGTNLVLAIIWNGSSANVPSANFIYPTVNAWNSYGYTSNGTNEHRMHLNTGSAATSTDSYSRSNSATITSYIGRDAPNNGYLDGYVMAYLQYDRVLTAAEIAQNYSVFSSRF